jgi:hypothetical protein
MIKFYKETTNEEFDIKVNIESTLFDMEKCVIQGPDKHGFKNTLHGPYYSIRQKETIRSLEEQVKEMNKRIAKLKNVELARDYYEVYFLKNNLRDQTINIKKRVKKSYGLLKYMSVSLGYNKKSCINKISNDLGISSSDYGFYLSKK